MRKFLSRNFQITFSIVFVLLWQTVVSAGTTGKIAGKMADGRDGSAIPGVNVFIEGTPLGATSDQDGFYYILNVPPGVYTVTATFIGYGTLTKTQVEVNIDQTTTIDFELTEQILEGETIAVVAEKPPVELDLTASKQTISGEKVFDHWGVTLRDAISDIPGMNANGGVRGGFGLHEAYVLDGMDMRDVGSNTNFKSVNTSAIQEVEVLTGGYNAEYGQANGAIMNIVTKSATDRIHGTMLYRMRPAGKYHWGSNIFSNQNFIRTVMTTPEFWDPNSTWQTRWMTEPHPGYTGDVEPFVSMSPEDKAAWWKNFVNDRDFNYQMDYADRMEWETETTVYGPINESINFMFSGRYKEGVTRYPSVLKYNPDMTYQGTLSYRLNTQTKIDVTGVYSKFENSGGSLTNFGSTEDTFHDDSRFPYVRDPYDSFLFWMYGFQSSSNFNMRGPEYADFYNIQTKLTYSINPVTFLEFAVQRSEMDYSMNFDEVFRSAYYSDKGVGPVPPEYPVYNLPSWETIYKWALPGDIWRNDINTASTSLKADLTSQILRGHQLKMGGIFSFQKFDKRLHDHQSSGSELHGHLTTLSKTASHPYEGAFYIQDKMEFEGMVINAGIRVDFFNANKTISSNFFDPLMISDSTVGNDGTIGRISFDPDGSGPGYTETPTMWAVSPRFGISHPITENTVLHFMYGEFNQRPPWQKISAPVLVRTLLPTEEQGGTSELNIDPDSALVYYNFYTHANPNPALTWEKMTQWEVGVKQNISDMFGLDVTMYYRNAYNLTSRGINQGPNNQNISSTGGPVFVEAYSDPNVADGRAYGRYIGFFETFVNGAWAQVRGIETTLASKFRFINFTFNYTFSMLTNGEYHYNEVYKYFPENNSFTGPRNFDDGRNGSDDDSWQPHNSAFLKLSVVSPEKFGPQIDGFYPLANWTLATSTRWSQGQRFTYYPESVPSGERVPNNMRWKDRWNTNMSLVYRLPLMGGMVARLSAQVTNLFNQKHLRLPSSSDRTRYFEEGKLPENDLTKEPLEWLWYNNNPREIYIGLGLEF